MDYALSIKQPWAALLVSGLKTIEVRRWSTLRRGRVLIHAARIPDDRSEAWAHVTPGVEAATRLRGGILGEAQLVGCNTYASRAAFACDHKAHLNEPHWFVAPVLYGFVFEKAMPLPFHRCTGSLHFFEVNPLPTPARTTTGLLVSVRNAAEADAAIEGGADVIDVKDPQRGPLGRAPDRILAEVVERVGGRKPVSAALGELADLTDAPLPRGVALVKCGLANLGRGTRWQVLLKKLRQRAAALPHGPTVVTVAYADWKQAKAPAWPDVADFALSQPGGVLLIDTFDKRAHHERPISLLDCLPVEDVSRLCRRAAAVGARVALAGSLRVPHLVQLLETRPTWFAVRGAVCSANDRAGEVHVLKVLALAELLRWKQEPAKTGS